jgi:hypothetical protein
MTFALDCEKYLKRDSIVEENSTGCKMDGSGMVCLFGAETKYK